MTSSASTATEAVSDCCNPSSRPSPRLPFPDAAHPGWQLGVERALARDFAPIMATSTSPEPGADVEIKKIQTQRARWATRKMTVKSGKTKRLSLLNRMQHRRTASDEKNSTGDGGNEPPLGDRDPDGHDDGAEGHDDDDGDSDSDESQDEKHSRTLYFNIPLPDDMLEEGHPIYNFPRNKIRTAKYTPLSFIPKNLWFQFHNVANIFFLFLVILVVSSPSPLVPRSVLCCT